MAGSHGDVSALLLSDMYWTQYIFDVVNFVVSDLLLSDIHWTLVNRHHLRTNVSDLLLSDIHWTYIIITSWIWIVSDRLHSDIHWTCKKRWWKQKMSFWPSTFWYTLNLSKVKDYRDSSFLPSTFWYTLNTLTWVFTFAVSDFLLFDKYKHPLTALIG